MIGLHAQDPAYLKIYSLLMMTQNRVINVYNIFILQLKKISQVKLNHEHRQEFGPK